MLASLARPDPDTPPGTLDDDWAGRDALEIPLAIGTVSRL